MSSGQGSASSVFSFGVVGGCWEGGPDTGLTSPATRAGESALDPLKKGQSWSGEEKRVLLGPSLSGVDQVGRSGGLIQTRRLTCEVASLDRAGGSAAPYLFLESAEEALPGPPRGADGTTNTAPEALQLALLFNGECCKTVICFLGLAAQPLGSRPRTLGGGVRQRPAIAPACAGGHAQRPSSSLPCLPGPMPGPTGNPTAALFFIPHPGGGGGRGTVGESLGRGVLG